MKRKSGTARNWLLRSFFLAVAVMFFAPGILPQNAAIPAANSPQAAPAENAGTPAQADVDRYTLSHERYEKAIAYAKAAYTLYFVSFFYGVLVMPMTSSAS